MESKKKTLDRKFSFLKTFQFYLMTKFVFFYFQKFSHESQKKQNNAISQRESMLKENF